MCYGCTGLCELIDGADKKSEGAKSIKNGVELSVLARRADEVEWDV